MLLTVCEQDLPQTRGAQRPRVLWVPNSARSRGQRAVELAHMAGLHLDPWQQFVLIQSMGERQDGRWAALEVALEAPRQNGKNGVTEARQLAGLYLLDEPLLIHSAHEFKTAEEALNRMELLIGDCPQLHKRLKPGNRGIKRSHGQEGIYLKSGQRLLYMTRTKGAGRGLSCPCLFLDEAMHLPETVMAALFFTLSAMRNPQLWYTGSAVDQETMPHGVVFARLRERALRGDDPSLAYFGFSAPFDSPDAIPAGALDDPEMWAMANPALGQRIREDHIAKERRSMGARNFAVERLGVGDWPATDGSALSKITAAAWIACEDAASTADDPLVVVFDVTPSRSAATVGCAGWRSDGNAHIEIIRADHGTGWVADTLARVVAGQAVSEVLYDERGPAASLLTEVEAAFTKAGLSVEMRAVNAREHAEACGMLFDAVEQKSVRHLGTTELQHAISGAATRPLGDAWAWARKTSSVDISPLVVVTLAHWGLRTIAPPSSEPLVAFV